MKELIVVYEIEQIDAVAEYLETASDALVVALDYWIGIKLEERGIAARPLTDYIHNWTSYETELHGVETVARAWYGLPEMAFLTHRGLSLGEMTEASLYMYLQQVRGYMLVLDRLLRAHPEAARLVVPHSTKGVTPTAGPFAQFETAVVPAVGAFVARHWQREYRTIGMHLGTEAVLFPEQPFMRSIMLRTYNFLIGRAPRCALRIVASDHWRNIKSIIEQLGDVELILIDRKELRAIPFLRLWKHRVRFMHPLDIMTARMRDVAAERARAFADAWEQGASAVARLPGFTSGDMQWWEIVEPAFRYIVCSYSERIVADIEALASIFEKEHIDRALIRASISGQHHFFILGELPRQFGVPSLEVQHGIGMGTIDPHSVFGLMHVDFMAAYGKAITEAYARAGYSEGRVPALGSPRFDRYFAERRALLPEERSRRIAALGLDPDKPTCLVVMPYENTGFPLGSIDLTSYEFRDFLVSLQTLTRSLPEMQYIFKFRPGAQREFYRAFLEELFPDTKGVAMESGDLFSYALVSDIVISSFSTAVIECLMARKPVILYPLKASEKYFYETVKDGVIAVRPLAEKDPLPIQEVVEACKKLVHDKTAYAAEVRRGELYLERNFTFDGTSAKRVADFLRSARVPQE